MAVAFRDYYYQALGVARDASGEDVRRAYRKLARQYHPDVNKQDGAEDRFKEIAEAYEVLRDPEKRERYDRLGANWRAGDDVSDAAGFEGFDRAGRPGDVGVEFGDGELSDFFERLFGARRGANGFEGFTARGADHEALLELSLEEAAGGGQRRLSLGDGRSYEVKVPTGVRDGQRIRLAGEGGSGSAGGPFGDLFLHVRLRPHPRFPPRRPRPARRRRRDTLGGRLGCHSPGPHAGRKLHRAPARGGGGSACADRACPARRGGHGDLYATVQISVPRKLSDRERDLFEQLAAGSSFDPRTERR